jgi:hypothetical protein
MKREWSKNEVIIENKTNNVVCVQKPKQYYYTIPHCKKGNIGAKYCLNQRFLNSHVERSI